MVFVTGDCHADFRKFSTNRFPEQKELTHDDIVIVCGDFGIWHDTNEERYWLKWLNEKPFTTVFVDGNHENFDRLYSDEFPIVDFHGGKAHKIRENIYHLMRGYVFEFDGKKYFAFGGASSHDISDGIIDPVEYDDICLLKSVIRDWTIRGKMFRINHISWWELELPTQEEMDFGMKTLEENNFSVDFIISHCCPQDVASAMGFRMPDVLTQYFNDVAHKTRFSKWYFGHYHREDAIWGKFILHYDDIERIS